MKYALLQYECKHHPGFYDDKMNVGDHVQSIAARQFLPQVDTYIDREETAFYKGDRVKLILNAWWHIWEGNAVPSEDIDPLYIAFHLVNPDAVPQKMLDYLKKHEPIGCRDETTLGFFQSKGIDAYFSGCLTLTLGKTYHVPIEQRNNKIYFVDFDRSQTMNWLNSKLHPLSVKLTPKKVRRRLENILDMFFTGQNEFVRRTHYCSRRVPQTERFRRAEQYLQDYSEAKLVVTTMIHVALPCLAMGTPVILVTKDLYDPRFSGIKELMNHLGIDKDGNLVEHLFFPDGRKGYLLGSSPDIPKIAARLEDRVKQFIGSR
ncbi:MAG: polysaccharide pyruvyl transferase family protein [Planctomycetaceae bacterium]|jgi:hypothetical protein|nr:polysaccharide pyruvyl transferase family protein [Planctomycetaceae bacterium]